MHMDYSQYLNDMKLMKLVGKQYMSLDFGQIVFLDDHILSLVDGYADSPVVLHNGETLTCMSYRCNSHNDVVKFITKIKNAGYKFILRTFTRMDDTYCLRYFKLA